MKSLVIVLVVLAISGESADKKRKIIPQPFENKHGLWTGPIVLGKQLSQLHLDTTAGNFFFVASNCKTTDCTKNRKGYDSSKSTTFKELPVKIPFSTSYKGAKQSGRIATDCLTAIGAAKPPRIPFPLVERTTGDFTTDFGDGVMGLGFADSKAYLPCTLFQLISNIGLDDASYSFHVDKFKHTSANGFEDSGFGIYGGIDTDNCKTDVVYHKISKARQWVIKVDKFESGGATFKGGHALVKPGPFHILGPKSEVDKIHKALNVQKVNGEPTFNCQATSQLKPLKMIVEGKTHEIAVDDYTVKSDDGKCYLLIKEVDSKTANGNDWVLGDALFRNRCVVFSFKKKSVGFTSRK